MEYRLICGLVCGICALVAGVRSQCYGEGKDRVKSSNNRMMFVFSGINNTCIAAILDNHVNFRDAKLACEEEFVNEGELVKDENKEYIVAEWKRRRVTDAFWVGFNSLHGSCVYINPNGSVGYFARCTDAGPYICQYPFNFDCVFKQNVNETAKWAKYDNVCKFPVEVIWQHSDLDHKKDCKRDLYDDTVPMEFCTLKFTGLRESWSSWADGVCSKPCADGGVKQIVRRCTFRNTTRNYIYLNQTLTTSCNTHIRCLTHSTRSSAVTNLPEPGFSFAVLIVIIAFTGAGGLFIAIGLILFCVDKHNDRGSISRMKRNATSVKDAKSRDHAYSIRTSIKSADDKKSVTCSKTSDKSLKQPKKFDKDKQSRKIPSAYVSFRLKSRGSGKEDSALNQSQQPQFVSFTLANSQDSQKANPAPVLSLPPTEKHPAKKAAKKKK